MFWELVGCEMNKADNTRLRLKKIVCLHTCLPTYLPTYALRILTYVRTYVRACVRSCVRSCVRAHVRVCVRARGGMQHERPHLVEACMCWPTVWVRLSPKAMADPPGRSMPVGEQPAGTSSRSSIGRAGLQS